MTKVKIVTELMLLCGCLHDIREKAFEKIVRKQLSEVEERIVALIDAHNANKINSESNENIIRL